MEGKVATIAGVVTGYIAEVLTGSFFIAILTAFCTGVVAYVGQQVAKQIHKKLRK